LIVVSLKSHHQATRMFTLLSSIQSVQCARRLQSTCTFELGNRIAFSGVMVPASHL
jgi:hypothetical protein